ncbi:MAG: Shikimate kinase [Methanomassiliicoccales archaeon PtaU1.Bin124]|nr:MAG: Shikimate kinase [Methanomassiliicoccales archaeon PtaU1.Bin124]
MRGSGVARSAGTVVNAIAAGRGCAFGIDLRTEADVELNESGKFEVTIEGSPGEDSTLVRLCVERVLKEFGREGMGAKVTTRSQIPISKGLKSSSAAANAVIKATLRAIGEDMQVMDAIRLGCECAIQAKVSVTGAYDDACASLLGGIVLTDNLHFDLMDREPMDETLAALIYAPDYQVRKTALPMEKIKANRDLAELAFILASQKQYGIAMKLNGMMWASIMGADASVMHEALAKGAVTAGLSGTGPAIVILAEKGRAEDLRSALGRDLIMADIYNCNEG